MIARVGKWTVVSELGAGRTGRAFVVTGEDDPTRQFVLKLWRDDQPGLEKDVNAREAERLRTAKAPRRMPTLVAAGEWNGTPFFVMEKIECVDYPIQTRKFRAFCSESFAALAELHAAGLLHCDLTPSHLGRKDGRIAFIDFDGARTFAEAATNVECIGTDPYIAPEVASRGELSVQSDLWALAMILAERCPEKLRECFEPVLRECLRPDPAERPHDAAEFAERLRTCRPPHYRFRSAAKWAAVAAVLTALSAVVLTMSSRLYRRANFIREENERRRAEACGIAAERYFYGQGVDRNSALSRKHAETAARLGDERGKKVLQLLDNAAE